MNENGKNTLDVIAGGAAFSSLLGWLPPIAAGLSIIYTLIRLWETETVKRWLGRKK